MFGFCKGCEQWLLRDNMLGITVKMYGKGNAQKIVRIRMCEPCHKKFGELLKSVEWDGVLLDAKPAPKTHAQEAVRGQM